MPCGNDPSGRVGRGCRPGMARLTSYVRGAFGVGTLGCFNPASRAGGVPSLHADGRAEDHAVDAHRDFDRGWRLFTWLIANADRIQLQEALYAGYLWSCKNRHLGIRGPGIQQAAHMNHVHDGISYYAADNFVVAWLGGAAPGPTPSPTPQPPQTRGDSDVTVERSDPKQGGNGSVWAISPRNAIHLENGDVWERVSIKSGGTHDKHPWALLQTMKDYEVPDSHWRGVLG